MGRIEAPQAMFPDPEIITLARARMPSIQYVSGPVPNSPTVLYLPGVSRDHRFYDGPEIVGALARRMSVVAVGYPYHEQRPEHIKDERPETKEDIAGAFSRAAEAIQLLDELQSGRGVLHIVAKSGGSRFALEYLRNHPEISARTVLTVLGLPPKNNFTLPLRGLTIIQGEWDEYYTPDAAKVYVAGYKGALGCEPTVIGVKGDHSFRGKGQDKENYDILPVHLSEVLETLKNLELERQRE